MTTTYDPPSIIYDPPSGWAYGFPKMYSPRDGETVADTLVRDGYPQAMARDGANHCRFIGCTEDLKNLIGVKLT